MEHFSFSPEPPSVREVASRSDDGRSFFLSHGKKSLPKCRIPVVFVWADSIVVLFSVLVYELAGPTLTKIALTAAGEIRPEGRTSARVENKPEEVA